MQPSAESAKSELVNLGGRIKRMEVFQTLKSSGSPMKKKSEVWIYSESVVYLDGEKRGHFQAVSHQDHTPLIHSFIHLPILQTLTACVPYTRQRACEGEIARRPPKLEWRTHLGVASLSIRVEVRGTERGGLDSGHKKPVPLPAQVGMCECGE